ncbi:MobH family relaxase [Sutterella sp.]|uniref:MobH family relaxase n=1 Tax=Sutterella sp. TaxID=1981025 RepID=UPI003FD70BE0
MQTIDAVIGFLYNIVIAPFKLCNWAARWIGRLIGSLFGLLKSKKESDSCPLFADIPEEAETDKIDAAWPPAPHPVEALSVQALIRANGKLIRDLCYATTLSENESQQYLLPVITNLARIVHLTPASEYDHHQGYGGLFTHSLEVAYYAANDAKTAIFDRSAAPKEIHQNKRRWILTAVLAALAHDIGKPFTDMEITAPDGRHWVQDEPIVDWLRRNHIETYYISFRPAREHNQHKPAALANISMLIPKATITFLGITGYGEQMMREFRSAILEGREGGLIGRILDNADGLSRSVDGLRQRKIRPEFKNVAHPQGDQLLKAIRVLIQTAKWTTNKDQSSRVFNTKQGCYLVWTEEVAVEARQQALDMGFASLPSDFLRLASILVDSGAAIRSTDEVANTHNVFWRMTPIVLGNVQFDCVRLADPQLIYDGVPPAEIESIVEGLAVDDVTKAAWVARWKFLPVQRLSREEEVNMGYTDEFAAQLAEDAERNLREHEEALAMEAAYVEEAPVPADEEVGVPPSEPDEASGEAGESSASNPELHYGEVSKNLSDPYGERASDGVGPSGEKFGEAISDLSDVPVGGVKVPSKSLESPEPPSELQELGGYRIIPTTSETEFEAGAQHADLQHRPFGQSQTQQQQQPQPPQQQQPERSLHGAQVWQEPPSGYFEDEDKADEPQGDRQSATDDLLSMQGDAASAGAVGSASSVANRRNVMADYSFMPEPAKADDKGAKGAFGAFGALGAQNSGIDFDLICGKGDQRKTERRQQRQEQEQQQQQQQRSNDDHRDHLAQDRAAYAAPVAPAAPVASAASVSPSDSHMESGEGDNAANAAAAAAAAASTTVPAATKTAADAAPGSAAFESNEPTVSNRGDSEEIDEHDERGTSGSGGAVSVSVSVSAPDSDEVMSNRNPDRNLNGSESESEIDHEPDQDTMAAMPENEVRRVFYNEPLDASGRPLTRDDAKKVDEPSSGHFKTKTPAVTGKAPSGSNEVANERGRSQRSGAGKGRSGAMTDYRLAQDLVESMLSQMERGSGIWLDGITTDPITGCWSTPSSRFEGAFEEGGIDPDLIEMAMDEMTEDGRSPRIEWDQKRRQLLLIKY